MAASTHHDDYQLFLAALKEVRLKAGVSQQDLADRIGNTQTFISKFERGERRLDMIETIEICEALRISPVVFLKEYLALRERGGPRGGKLASKG